MIEITLEKENQSFQPGEEIAGQVRWRSDPPPQEIEIRLGWHTSGIGMIDSEAVEVVRVDHPSFDGTYEFRFAAPSEPYSFEGTLVSLHWGIQAEVLGPAERGYIEIVIGPGEHAVVLTEVPKAST